MNNTLPMVLTSTKATVPPPTWQLSRSTASHHTTASASPRYANWSMTSSQTRDHPFSTRALFTTEEQSTPVLLLTLEQFCCGAWREIATTSDQHLPVAEKRLCLSKTIVVHGGGRGPLPCA